MTMIQELIEAIHEISRYTGEDSHAVLSKVLNGTRVMAHEWNTVSPQTDREIIDFYRTCHSQVYGLVGYNYFNRSRYLLSHKIVERCRGRVLDFGAGIGGDLIRLWKRGVRSLTHADFEGYTRNFAACRYAARGMDINLVSPDELAGEFDCIICLDVIEHAPNPAALLTHLARHMAPEGKLFLNAPFGQTGDHPMHFDRPPAFDEFAHLAWLGVNSRNIFTAKDLLFDIIEAVEQPLTRAERNQLLQAFPGNLDLLVLCALAQPEGHYA